jgi:hypothetical protein
MCVCSYQFISRCTFVGVNEDDELLDAILSACNLVACRFRDVIMTFGVF